MKFGRRTSTSAREEKQRKLEYARLRARELLPLCEQATGVKLQLPLVVNASSLPKLLLGTQARILGLFIKRHIEERGVLDAFEYLGFVGASVKLNLRNLLVWDAFGYYSHATRSIGINLANFNEGTSNSDYTVAHEIVHLLLFQLGLGTPINSHIVLFEGAATFYGEQVVQTFDPSFDITVHSSFGGVYEEGYGFFKRLKDEGFEPVDTINNASPLVSSSYKCENCGRTHTKQVLMNIEQYLTGLRILSVLTSDFD